MEGTLGHNLSDSSAATFSGLVVEHLGRVPQSGQKIELNGLVVKILDSDNKRINLMRVRSISDTETAGKKETN